MAKKNFSKGVENVWGPTIKENDRVFRATVKEIEEKNEVKKSSEIEVVTEKEKIESKPEQKNNTEVSYNLRYPKELKKRIKRFCIEHDGIDMKDVFTQGAIQFMSNYK